MDESEGENRKTTRTSYEVAKYYVNFVIECEILASFLCVQRYIFYHHLDGNTELWLNVIVVDVCLTYVCVLDEYVQVYVVQ